MIDYSYQFYQQTSLQLLEKDNCSIYMRGAEKIIREERDMLRNFFNEESVELMMEKVQKALLVEPMKQILEMKSGLEYIMENEKIPDISCMFRLYKPLEENIKVIAQMMRVIIFKRGERIVESIDEDMASVEEGKQKQKILESSFLDDLQ